MNIQSLLTPSRVLCRIEAGNKRRALEILANTIAKDIPTIDAETLFRRFMARERLGSTGIGYGIAIPHCSIEECSDAVGALITLTEPLDFDAVDSQPVDILFAMLVPEGAHAEHLQNLAALANAMNDEKFRQQLRDAGHDAQLYQAATE
ncbi:MAG: PTS sugar transporter subunit IIA [Pseudomonadota bacterium]